MSKVIKYFISSQLIDDEIEILRSEFKISLDSFQIINESGLDSVFLGILDDSYLLKNIGPTISYEYSNLYIIPFEYPSTVSPSVKDQQEVQQMILRGKIDRVLQKYNQEIGKAPKKISIVLAYNQTESSLKIKTNKNMNQEENVVPYRITSAKYKLESVVLSDQLISEIHKTLVLVKNFYIIFDEWGFREIDPNMRTIINFFGPSGTGKTMTAHAMAHELNKKLMSLNYSEIESKYVGDAPKNLVRAFEEARDNDAILFFDEADSFLGKRITNVTHSSDQSINSLRSQMLILLDNFDGVVIFATNLVENYDKAFNSRIISNLHFELPDLELRKRLINNTLPVKVKYENDQKFSESQISELGALSDGFSGREIKNAVLSSLTNAIVNNRDFVIFSDFESAFLSAKDNKEKIEQESKSIKFTPEIKKSLEEGVKNHLEMKP